MTKLNALDQMSSHVVDTYADISILIKLEGNPRLWVEGVRIVVEHLGYVRFANG